VAKKFHSPLRYPGGKGKLLPFVKDLIIHNHLGGGSYSEPYAGGAGVALGLLFDDYVSEIHINDFDYGIYSFWHSILYDVDNFLEKLWNTSINIENRDKQKHTLQNQNNFSQLEIGFATFYLNRTNVSGVVTGGAIGGVKQLGKYKIDARFNKKDLAKRISQIAYHQDSINLYNLDAIDFIAKTLPNNKTKGLIFLDPPYYAKGKKLYTSFYEHEDHQHVAEAIKTSPHKHWIITYDNIEAIENIYDLTNKIVYDLRYSLTVKNKKGSEFLFYSDYINLPYHPNYPDVPIQASST